MVVVVGGWRDIKLSKWRKAKCGREICANDLDMILVEYRGGKGGNVSVDQAYDAYMKDWSPTAEGDTDRDRKKRRSHLSKCLKKMKATFRPKSDQRKYVFQRDQFLQVVVDRVPADDFKWKRREKIDHRRLNVWSDASVTVTGNVDGDVDAGNSVTVTGFVAGNIDAGNSVTVGGDVHGDISAGNKVTVHGVRL